MTDVAQLAPGETFAGRYRIERLLKAGGMGAVYVAAHTETRRRVALKVMRPEIVADADARARFAQEAQVGSIIESANIVDVYDAGVDAKTGMPFLVMELLVGKELGELLRERGRLSASEAIAYMTQTARALDRAHAAGVVHRDLKPENLFLVQRDDEPPKIKILDFGIAKLLLNVTSQSTHAGGTPLYMAPEQTRRSSKVGPHTDVWALGLIAYSLLVGRPYWEAEDIHQLYGEILSGEYDPPVHRAALRGVTLPAAFDEWFFRCVHREPTSRFARAGEASAALAKVFGETPLAHAPTPAPGAVTAVQAPTPTPAATMPMVTQPMPQPYAVTTASPVTEMPAKPVRGPTRPSPSRTPILAIGGVVLAAVVGIVIWQKFKDDTPTKPQTDAGHIEADTAVPDAAKAKPVPLTKQVESLNRFVALSGLELHEHEVTRAEYALYLQSFSEKDRKSSRPLDSWSSTDDESPTRPHTPVTWITHEQATSYCTKIEATLPSSEQWGKALPSKFPWGKDWPATYEGIALAHPDKDPAPLEVSSSHQDKTPLGIADLAGNVSEWTSTVNDGAATLRGADLTMKMNEAQDAIGGALQKFTAVKAGATAQKSEIAGPRLGFRCARTI